MGLQRKSDSSYYKSLNKLKVKLQYETEKFICVKSNNMGKFNKKWDLCMGSLPLFPSICVLITTFLELC